MNQVLKDHVYSMGCMAEVRFLAEIGGMNDEEQRVFELYHEGKTDLFVQEELGIDKKTLSRIEESVRTKLTVAIIKCINFSMDNIGKG